MEKRYGRANERYRAKIQKSAKKMPFERKMVISCISCAAILIAGCASSFVCPENGKAVVRNILYNSTTVKEIKDFVLPAAKLAKIKTANTINIISDAIKSGEKHFGITEPKPSVPVKAESAKKKSSKKEPVKKENKKNAETEPKEEKISFSVPLNGEITSLFGSRTHPISGNEAPHTGIDLAAQEGDAVFAAAAGIAEKTGEDSANGKYVVLRHSENVVSVYAHLSEICVSEGENVLCAAKIGEAGSSGNSTGPHLHFEIKENGKSVNPENYISLPHRGGV